MRCKQLENKVAIITGAGRGIGRAIALEWASRGGLAMCTDVDEDAARSVAREIADSKGSALHRRVDVRSTSEIMEAVQAAVETWGGLDALFNVAGINLAKSVEECEDDDWSAVIDINLTSVYRCSRHAIPKLRKRGGGAIVNISSIAGIQPENRCAAYSASKAGVNALTKNMAMDFAKDGIRVNAICPAGALTPRTQSYFDQAPDIAKEVAALRPMNRFAEPSEIARPAVFLATPDASYITGATLVVDGGLIAGFRSPMFERL